MCSPLLRLFLVLSILLPLLIAACAPSATCGDSLTIAGKTQVCLEIVETPEDIGHGLSGHDPMPDNQGMLFIFQNSGRYAFWMKEMRFPLDFIWIANDTVVDLTENVPVPTSEPLPLYRPRDPVNRVLEVNAGFVGRHGVKTGDKVVLNRESAPVPYPTP